LPRHLYDSSETLGDIPVPGTVSIAGPSTAGNEFGVAFIPQVRPSPFGYTCDAPVTWRTHRSCSVSSLAGYLAGPTGKWGKRLQGRTWTPTRASVSPSSLRQGPRSMTVSARISLSEVTPSAPVLVTVFGSLGRGWHPGYGAASCRSMDPSGSLTPRSLRERSRGRAQT
jgi:hypothetical protein